MKIVIQCAATKTALPAGAGFRTNDDRTIKFVARPPLAPNDSNVMYAHPDSPSGDGKTWRENLIEYNLNKKHNPLKLPPAYALYANDIYGRLVKKFGGEKVFILSAGWGLIPSDFLTPDYDITFSSAKNVENHCRRTKYDVYNDLSLMPKDDEEIIFLGGKSYLPLFEKLTKSAKGKKKVFFNSANPPLLGEGFVPIRFHTAQRTNWHYPCAEAVIDGTIKF